VRLFAALVPPAAELSSARVLAAEVPPVADPTAEALPEARKRPERRGWFRRRRTEHAHRAAPMLNLIPTAAMHLPMVKFGNLSKADADRLADELERRATEWASPRLRLSGGLALQSDGRTSVFAKLSGDVEELRDVIRGVSHVALGLHLFVDRRVFQPELQLGTVNNHTTTAYLDALLAELEAFESNAWWQTSFTLMVPTDDGPGPVPLKTYREISLGPAVAH
jgi:2'-5' RNA ligase